MSLDVEVFHRDGPAGDTWVLQIARAGQTLQLTSQGVEVPINEVYSRPG